MIGHAATHEWIDPLAGGFALQVTAWAAMTVAMMAPLAWPWVRAFRRLLDPGSGTAVRVASTVSFAGGYLTAWLGWAVAAAALQQLLRGAGLIETHGGTAAAAGSAILIGAGIFQFTPLKRACLRHCRNPLSFLLIRWRDGPPAPYRIGLAHGVYCVGCCWALMATMLAVGMTGFVWMAALTIATIAEQVLPSAFRLPAAIGTGLIAAGLFQAARI
jgi:predicted metal-binding membrane protein